MLLSVLFDAAGDDAPLSDLTPSWLKGFKAAGFGVDEGVGLAGALGALPSLVAEFDVSASADDSPSGLGDLVEEPSLASRRSRI